MYDTLGVYTFMVVIGLFIAILLLGLGISLGREYERIDNRRGRQSSDCERDDNNIHSDLGNSSGDSTVGDVHG